MNALDRIDQVRDALTVRRVYGDPYQEEGVTVIPAASVAGGGGAGSDVRGNGGGGFGLSARPVGAWVIRDGEVKWHPAHDLNRVIFMGQLVAIAAPRPGMSATCSGASARAGTFGSPRLMTCRPRAPVACQRRHESRDTVTRGPRSASTAAMSGTAPGFVC